MSSFDLDSDHGETNDLMKALTDIICLLKKRYGYSDLELLGEGSYGVVIRYRQLKNEGDVAVKCIFLGDVREGEKHLWIGLRRQNIVPLLQWTIFEALNVLCLEMKVYEQDLFTAVRKVEYLQSAEALQQLKMRSYHVVSFHADSDHGETNDLMKALAEIICLLKKRYGYSHPELLGEGSYGVVIRFRQLKNEGDVAVKCIFLGDVREGEKHLWIGLRLQNTVSPLRWTILKH
ncbi:hypothetical protein AVEN_155814-1 [Araneus ventricosus]|uniref:Protein kinase domain-containing protein n=1 Tax=Araneus ventricosus TaxID=182803 RepID=A0A4Y2G636_ARAVE|nr:hypothetical protein AVEN_155814-1 [Araneus ventricosus]